MQHMKKAALCFSLLLFFLNAHAAQVNLEVTTNPGYADNTTTIQNDDVRITMEQNAARQQNMNSELYGWLDQSLKTTATPYFTGLSLKGSLHLQGTTAPYRVSLFAGTPTANRLWRLPIEAPPVDGIKNISVNSSGQWIFTDPTVDGVTTFGDLTDVDKTGWQEGRTVKFDSSGNLIVGDDQIGAPGDGDITGVTAGEGLTGGGLVGDVLIAISSSILDRIAANDAKIGVTTEEQNVNADWTASSGDEQILNKPTLGTAASRAAESVLTDGVNLPTGSAIKTYSDSRYVLQAAAGTASGKDFENTLTDGGNLPTGAAIKAYGDENWLGSGSGDGLTSQPTTTMQYLKSTGADAYEWAEVDFYTDTEIDGLLASYYTSTEIDTLTSVSATVNKLAGQDVSVSSVNIPQSSVPQLFYMKPASGAGGNGWAAPATSSNSYLLSLQSVPPTSGKLLSIAGPATTVDYGGGLNIPTFPVTFVDPSTGGGGSIEINEVTNDPNPSTLAVNSITAATSTGNIFLKTATGVYSGAFSYVADADYPLILSATVPSAGNSLVVIYNQDMVDGTELGDWYIDCIESGLFPLTTPTGTGTSAYTYPISGGLIQQDELCQLYYTAPTDGIEAEDDGVKLQDISGSNIANNSSYVPDVADTTLFFLDMEGTETEDLSGGWVKQVDSGSATTDYTLIVLSGTQSARLNSNSSSSVYLKSPAIADADTIYYSAQIQTSSTATSSMGFYFMNIDGETETTLGRTGLSSGFRAYHGSTNSAGITIAGGTKYYMCGKFQVATSDGANDGMHLMNLSTTSNPVDGTTVGVTNGNSFSPINRVWIRQTSSNALVIDDIKGSTEVLPECGELSL
jgi:hypothetical protein